MINQQQTSPSLKKTQKQILSGMFVAISLLFLASCMIGKETTHKIAVVSDSNYWKITVKGYADVWATPNYELENANNQTTVSINLTTALIPLNSPQCEKNTKSLGYNNVTLSFGTLSTGEYTFYNSKFNLISHGKNYTLKPVDGKAINTTFNITPQKNSNGAYFWPHRAFRYELPILCSKLDNAIIQVSGIYKNGKELPPIKFRINLLNQEGIKS